MADYGTQAKRSRCRIFADILTSIQSEERAKITHVIHDANLPHGRLMDYLVKMERSRLIDIMKDDDETYYTITEKGRRYLVEFKKYQEFGDAFGVEI
jgi:predicted transcriptional regulator